MKLTSRQLRKIIREELNLFESDGDTPYRVIRHLVADLPRPEGGARLAQYGVQERDVTKFMRTLPGPQPISEEYQDGFHAGHLFTQLGLMLQENGWHARDIMSGFGVGEDPPTGPLRALFIKIMESPKWRSAAKAGLAWAKHAFPKGGFVDPGFVKAWSKKYGIATATVQPPDQPWRL